jgi:hypothetical protein
MTSLIFNLKIILWMLKIINLLFKQELEKSKYATQALDLSKMQEDTKQKEQLVKIKEYEAHIEQLKIEQKQVDGEQRRKTLEEEAKQAKYKAEYQVNRNCNFR